jgi:hypothetical protein
MWLTGSHVHVSLQRALVDCAEVKAQASIAVLAENRCFPICFRTRGMDKLTIFVVIAVSVFLYFTHDAGFQFESEEPAKRAEFVERQARRAASGAHFLVSSDRDAVLVSRDQKSVRLKIPSDRTANFDRRRADVFRKACEGYRGSFLDEHDVTLRFEFYRSSGAMAGSMKVTPGACASAAKSQK